MKNLSGFLPKVLVAIFIGLLIAMLYGHFMGYDLSISWNVTTTADSREFPAHTFQKGPFQFNITGEKYTLAETFSAGPIERNYVQDAVFLIIIFFGICIILTVSTYLSRFWFIGVMALFIFFIISLHLPEIGLFGYNDRSSVPIIILLATYLLPAYFFHAFYTHSAFIIRLIALIGVSILVVLFSQVDVITFQEQLISGSYFGLVILTLLFLLLIAEENIYAILYLVTKSKGSKNNHIHFSVFSTIYLGFLVLYYCKKAGLINLEITYFDPYILLGISSLIALWGLQFKKPVFENFISLEKARILFAGLGILVFGFLGLSFFRGNDPVYEGMHYFIVYVHLGFGAMFFLYLIINFINPLSEGLEVYKIAYKEQNFPYVSAKLAGLAAVAAFFFLASKEPFLLFRAGHYNYLGDQAETSNQTQLAQEYFREGSIYGYDNHFSNYKLGYHQLQKGDIDEANYRFGRATLRYPSPHSFVNHAGTFAIAGETTPSIVSLKNGLREFPENNQLLNNLGLTYVDLGDYGQAETYFRQSAGESEWTNANKVNLWKVKSAFQLAELKNDYTDGNLAVKTNILSTLLENDHEIPLPFDSAAIFPSYPLHRSAFLINSAWYFKDTDVYRVLSNSLTGPIEENMHNTAMHAIAMNQYLTGNVNMAVRSLDQLQAQASKQNQAQYLNELGLIALDQHAKKIALDYFEKALEAGSEAALLNKAASLMELGQHKEARKWAETLVAIDSGFQELANDLSKLKNRENLDPNQQLSRLYYFYSEYSLPEMSILTNESDTVYLKTLWEKISKEELKKKNYESLKRYMTLFKSRLNKKFFLETEFLIGLADDKLVKNEHPVSQILQKEDSSRIANDLANYANKNAFNSPLVIAVANLLKNYDIQLAYDVMVEAIAINNLSAELYKHYALTALETGLFNYAMEVLPKIESLTTESEFEAFFKTFSNKKEEVESATEW